MNRLYAFLLVLFVTLASSAAAQDELSRRDVVTGLDVPVEITWGPDDWIWFAEKSGRVGRIDPSTGEIRVVYQVTDLWETNESGLIGMAVVPTLADAPYVYLAWTYFEEQESRLRLVRYRYDGTTLRDSTQIFHRVAADAYSNGGRLSVTPDKKILMTVGVPDIANLSMSPFFLNGKVLRMNFDGSVPSDNPSRLAPTPINLIWSVGHRDGRGIVGLPGGTVFQVEQGRDSVDELNVIQRRRNYGWPRVVGNCDQVSEQRPCNDSNVAVPTRMWRENIYPSSLDYYNNPAIPELSGSLLMTTLDEQDLRQLKISGTSITEEIVHFDREFGRLRDLCIAPDGRIFLATSNRDERGIGSNFPGSDRIIEIGGNRAVALLGTPVVSGDSAWSFLAGDSVTVAFSASNFADGNIFSLEISDGTGNFASSRTIGELEGTTGGTITGIIPCDTTGASRYRFRIVAGSPSATKVDASGGYRIIPPIDAVISPNSGVTICPGDSVVLRGRIGVENRWSNGEIGDSIVVRETGDYYVVAHSNGCGRRSSTVAVTVAPLPQPQIQLLGTSTLDAGNRFAAYRWYRNDTLLPEAVSRSYNATMSGTYTVMVRSDEGCWNTSAPFELQFSGVEDETGLTSALLLRPHPVRDRLSLELPSVDGGSVEVVVSDMAGRELLRRGDDAMRGAFRMELDVSALASGPYLVRVRCGDGVWNARFVRE